MRASEEPARYGAAMSLHETYEARVEAGELKRDPAQARAIEALDAVRRAVEQPVKKSFLGRRRPEPGGGLYLWGGVGRGKSMLMDMMVAQTSAPVRRVHFHAFMQEVHRGMHEERKSGVDDALAPVVDRIGEGLRLLALDEMQVTDITDAMIVGRLFERLLGAGVWVVTTSNRPPSDLYKDGLNRALFVPFIEMIEDRLTVLELASGTDHRQGRMEGSPVWFCPVNPETRGRFRALWQELAPGAEPLALRVQGRDVVLPGFQNGVARASFRDLCDRPLGPADYLAIADAVRVLFLEEIPRLGRGNFNEAKRFVTLVDALYEARVRLVALAADLPESLYVEGEGAFEFARTESRLREMMSAGWGAGRAD